MGGGGGKKSLIVYEKVKKIIQSFGTRAGGDFLFEGTRILANGKASNSWLRRGDSLRQCLIPTSTYLPTDDDDDDGPRHVVTLAVAKLVVDGGKQ